MVTCFGMEGFFPVSTPLTVKHDLSLSQSPNIEAEKWAYQDYAGNIYYFSLVSSLLFATQTHSNIQFAVGLIVS